MTTNIINVASGKGGTGKTLLCSILAELLGNKSVSVLLVDLDFFVRGLTSLLYFHKHEAIHLVEKNQLTVSDIFVFKDFKKDIDKEELGISRYRSFDILPSVSRIDELLNYKDIMPDNRDIALECLKKLITKIRKDYDLIIFDCRSGYDELISAVHSLSDFTICVEEEDDISKITADNLIKQLRNDSNTPIFRILNKARSIRSEKDLAEAKRSIGEVGPIPFDIDVMNSFGRETFWEEINRSLYKSAVIKAWNKLCTKMALNYELPDSRVSPVVSEQIEKMFTLFGGHDRVLLFYGAFIALLGFGFAVTGQEFLTILRQDPIRAIGFVSGLFGVLMIFTVFLKSKK